ncbi:uncharacterized protein Z518_03774 [Rhinocladiella mackenziei CBS 650.93]|uniref:Uncharacterized protein n=1 Tax=Rhinocladiella mackenziei CBS 650.93 TaxID=1442369 RepID=A0A0D2FUN1_9EURO|nr:uncharacterized protein Z518_03774 [Rhinocladiella mackenziei CBS 650.93]KIX05802.1 hypothetical protein Z518_03774 [Rhinocladiella mackenziei CBS 650.93]
MAPSTSSIQGAIVSALRVIILNPQWKDKITTIRFQLTETMSSELFSLAKDESLATLKEKLGRATELPNLTEVEFYFTTPLSKGPHRIPTMLFAQPTPTSSQMVLSRLLQEERDHMRHLIDLLPSLFAQVQKLRLNRIHYYGGRSVSEPIEMNEPLVVAVSKILERRTIGIDRVVTRPFITAHPESQPDPI